MNLHRLKDAGSPDPPFVKDHKHVTTEMSCLHALPEDFKESVSAVTGKPERSAHPVTWAGSLSLRDRPSVQRSTFCSEIDLQ